MIFWPTEHTEDTEKSKGGFILFILLIPVLVFCMAGESGLQEPIIEKVEVINVEIPVRVFFKGKPVACLTKSDFKLFINGREREINGFYESRKILTAPGETAEPPEGTPSSSRLFVLLFNLNYYDPDVLLIPDIFFDKVFRPDDRLIIITNRFFFGDRMVPVPSLEREKLKQVLINEMEAAAERFKDFQRQMETMLRSFKARLKYTTLRDLTCNEFVSNYRQLLVEFKAYHLRMDDARYLELAGHLKEQKVEKWVLSFYQVGRFFKPRWNSEFRKILLGNDFFRSTQRYHELQEALEVDDPLLDVDLSKVFVDTGAAFHTVLMEEREGMRNDLSADLSFRPVVSAVYGLLEKIAKGTGGTFKESRGIPGFFKDIAAEDDICYMLTYEPGKGDDHKRGKIEVTVRNEKYDVYYDDGKRGAYFRQLVSKAQPETPLIRIDEVSYDRRLLTFIVSGFKIDDRNRKTELPVRLQVFNRHSESIFDGVESFTIKDIPVNKVKLQISFPDVPPGTYDVFIWISDPLTGRSDVAVKEIAVDTTTLTPGFRAFISLFFLIYLDSDSII